MSWPWSQLGLPGPCDLPEIRHAYAEKLKVTHPEEDPEGFQRLHSAYQLASRLARQQKRQEPRQPKPQPERKCSAPKQEPPREEFDFDELLSNGDKLHQKEESDKQDFNYDELLQDADRHYRPFREEDGERNFNFEELLREDETPLRPQQDGEEQDWDYERLFAEGEAERAEARRRRGEERRRKQKQAFQERQQQWTHREERLRDQFCQQEDRWQNTETILHTIEMMYDARAGVGEWQKFFQSPLFQQNRGTLDLIFGLEDFVSTRNLSQECRLALFTAYGFEKGVSRPELRPLYQMLFPAWKAVHGDKRQQIRGVAVWLVCFVVLTVMCHRMGAGMTIPLYFLAFGGILWVLWQVVRAGSMAKRARGEKAGKREELRAMLGFGLAVAGLFMVGWLRSQPKIDIMHLLPSKDPREQVCQYMEEDFGIPFQSIYNKVEMERYSNVFAPEGDVEKMFLAGPNGSRKGGQTGYTTNYPEMRMLWALEDFGEAHEVTGITNMDRGLPQWETKGIFLISLPAFGAEETITDLGELLEKLSQEVWYQNRTPECEIVLCSQEMEEGRLILFRWRPEDGAFHGEEVLNQYVASFGHSYCAQLLKELELDWNFIREEGEHYTLTNEGMAEMRGEDCCKLFGLDESGAVAMEYYVNLEGTTVYCVPGDFWETNNREEQITFYRLLHREDNLGLVHLFYPWLKAN